MKKHVTISARRPQYICTTGVAFAQVNSWFGHCIRDLKMDLIYPEDKTRRYPCVVWICGGAWLQMDRSAHLTYLSRLALQGFVVASVEYRTSNEAHFPEQVQDVKAAIRYLRAHADRFNINPDAIGTMGESAGGYLTAMTAVANDPAFDTGDYLDYSSRVQAAVPWYPPTDIASMQSARSGPSSPESLLCGKNVAVHLEEAKAVSPVHFVTKDAPPIMMIHGTDDHTVPFAQSEELYDLLEKAGCDVTLIAIDGADHASIPFFQDGIWDMIITFFKEKLGN